jgi:hypothetical protein
MPCSQVDGDVSSWWWRQYAPLKRRSTSTWLHGSTTQKTLKLHARVQILWMIHTSQLGPVRAVKNYTCHTPFYKRIQVDIFTRLLTAHKSTWIRRACIVKWKHVWNETERTAVQLYLNSFHQFVLANWQSQLQPRGRANGFFMWLVVLGGLVFIVLAIGPKVRWIKLGRGR